MHVHNYVLLKSVTQLFADTIWTLWRTHALELICSYPSGKYIVGKIYCWYWLVNIFIGIYACVMILTHSTTVLITSDQWLVMCHVYTSYTYSFQEKLYEKIYCWPNCFFISENQELLSSCKELSARNRYARNHYNNTSMLWVHLCSFFLFYFLSFFFHIQLRVEMGNNWEIIILVSIFSQPLET